MNTTPEQEIFQNAVDTAFNLLDDDKLDTPEARVLMMAIALQESRLVHRRQIGGPARGFWQFEEGTRKSRGGVWGVVLHPASRRKLEALCDDLAIDFDAESIYEELDTNDTLAAGVARLLLLTDPKPLPEIGDEDGAWAYYLRNWRPGKPHPDTWPALYQQAVEYVQETEE